LEDDIHQKDTLSPDLKLFDMDSIARSLL